MKLNLVAALVGAACVSGCASIVSGVSQPVSIETRLDGAPIAGVACRLSSNKGTWFVTTPGQVTLHRGFQDLAIECNKPGLTPSISTASSHVRALFFGNIIFGGLIGMAVDLGDGAAFDYDDLISIEMGGKAVTVSGTAPAISRPAVSTPVVTVATPPVAAAPVAPTIASPAVPAAPAPMPAAVTAPIAAARRAEHRYQISAETFAKTQSCRTASDSTLMAFGPGYETYAVPCAAGETLIVRCEFGNCRALR